MVHDSHGSCGSLCHVVFCRNNDFLETKDYIRKRYIYCENFLLYCNGILTIFYAAGCRHCQSPFHGQRFSNYSAIVGSILNGEDNTCEDEVDIFVSWCDPN